VDSLPDPERPFRAFPPSVGSMPPKASHHKMKVGDRIDSDPLVVAIKGEVAIRRGRERGRD